MKLQLETNDMEKYLQATEIIDYTNPLIQETVYKLFESTLTEIDKVKKAFEFVRDEISHSWDIQGTLVTCAASEVLTHKQGICYAKSHLLAAILRASGIPTGFCYQRLMLFDTPEQGYVIHALNAVYLSSLQKWIRLDARGNKPGVVAEFSVEKEKLAFSIQADKDEIDYPIVFAQPNHNTINTLKTNRNAIEMYTTKLPEFLSRCKHP
ncbi:transglutaminase family protein [Gracilibacillus sp. S3-1-1]|uniref:Transglutaminase family protein n=1 Tax=Gracilibacillus pellucidus TaxID=3095368 RepID=A0ACC6M6H3_9BACI|nr:transglutaminase family protein [Gracilibacillus sp. S3-1-1]MDX8046458.1 transglutaminase family protein [Gracilibacillus sp. S3-1-1]